MPKVSVTMSVFNGERHLRGALDSLPSQTCRYFKTVLYHDSSTDPMEPAYYSLPGLRNENNTLKGCCRS
jgi:hypothetical protein